jgi:hypothetical protein
MNRITLVVSIVGGFGQDSGETGTRNGFPHSPRAAMPTSSTGSIACSDTHVPGARPCQSPERLITFSVTVVVGLAVPGFLPVSIPSFIRLPAHPMVACLPVT